MSGPIVTAIKQCVVDGTVSNAWRTYLEGALRNAHYENSLVKFRDEQIMRGNRNAVTEGKKGVGSVALSAQTGSPSASAAAIDRRQSTSASTATFTAAISGTA